MDSFGACRALLNCTWVGFLNSLISNRFFNVLTKSIQAILWIHAPPEVRNTHWPSLPGPSAADPCTPVGTTHLPLGTGRILHQKLRLPVRLPIIFRPFWIVTPLLFPLPLSSCPNHLYPLVLSLYDLNTVVH